MKNSQNRVLGRTIGHEISPEQAAYVSGGSYPGTKTGPRNTLIYPPPPPLPPDPDHPVSLKPTSDSYYQDEEAYP